MASRPTTPPPTGHQDPQVQIRVPADLLARLEAQCHELSAETFGVAQTRRRVFMVAHRDRAPHRPAPTHQRYRKGRARVEPADMLGLLPWVSMAEALDGCGPIGEMHCQRGAGMSHVAVSPHRGSMGV